MNRPRHVLKLSCGLTVELAIDEGTGRFDCRWSSRPTLAALPVIEKEYIPWRNDVIEAWARRTGNSVLLVDL